MEQLTKRSESGTARPGPWAENLEPAAIIQRLCDRLADYEDTGMKLVNFRNLKPLKSASNNPREEFLKQHEKLKQAVKHASYHVSVTNSEANRAAYDKAVEELETFELTHADMIYLIKKEML